MSTLNVQLPYFLLGLNTWNVNPVLWSLIGWDVRSKAWNVQSSFLCFRAAGDEIVSVFCDIMVEGGVDAFESSFSLSMRIPALVFVEIDSDPEGTQPSKSELVKLVNGDEPIVVVLDPNLSILADKSLLPVLFRFLVFCTSVL